MKNLEHGNQKRRLDLQPENEMNWANVNECIEKCGFEMTWIDWMNWIDMGVNERSERVGVIVEVVEVGGRGKGDMAKCVGREARETVGKWMCCWCFCSWWCEFVKWCWCENTMFEMESWSFFVLSSCSFFSCFSLMLVQPRSRNERRSWQCRTDRRIGTSHIRTVGQIPELGSVQVEFWWHKNDSPTNWFNRELLDLSAACALSGWTLAMSVQFGIPEGKVPALVSWL